MKFIKQNEISSKIMTLLEESDEFSIVVSPYVKISKWYKLLKKIQRLRERSIPIEFVIREDKTNQTSFQEMEMLGLEYKAIKDLHCKLYLNEKYAIVSSMNMLLSSEINSIELAYRTETKEEYDELVEFCKRYLNITFKHGISKIDSDVIVDLSNYVLSELEKTHPGFISLKEEGEAIEINTLTNKYSCFIWNAKKNHLRISGILSGKEYQFYLGAPDYLPKIDNFNIDLREGGHGHYSSILATSEIDLRSSSVVNAVDSEREFIAKSIIEFVRSVDEFKKTYYLQ